MWLNISQSVSKASARMAHCRFEKKRGCLGEADSHSPLQLYSTYAMYTRYTWLNMCKVFPKYLKTSANYVTYINDFSWNSTKLNDLL